MKTINYILRYFLARSLYNAVRSKPPPNHHREMRWQDGDEIMLKGRGHFVVQGGKWVHLPLPSAQ